MIPMNSRATTWERGENPLWPVTGFLLRPLQLGLAYPSVLFLAAMAIFLCTRVTRIGSRWAGWYFLWRCGRWRYEKSFHLSQA